MVDQAERQHDRVVITAHGRPAAMVVSVDDVESLEETLRMLSRAALLGQIRESLVQAEAGEAVVLSREEARASVARR